MSMKYGKSEIAKVSAVLDEDHATIEEATLACLSVMEEVFEDRCKFVVVAQLRGTLARPSIPPSDPDAIKVSLGFYSTEGDAIKAAESMAYSSATGESFSAWVLPVHHGTPADLHAKQKEKYAAAEQARKDKASEKFKASIEKRRLEIEERARAGKGSCANCGHQPYDHTASAPRGRCVLSTCDCTEWKEKK